MLLNSRWNRLLINLANLSIGGTNIHRMRTDGNSSVSSKSFSTTLGGKETKIDLADGSVNMGLELLLI